MTIEQEKIIELDALGYQILLRIHQKRQKENVR